MKWFQDVSTLNELRKGMSYIRNKYGSMVINTDSDEKSFV